jgi:hypothetical protein
VNEIVLLSLTRFFAHTDETPARAGDARRTSGSGSCSPRSSPLGSSSGRCFPARAAPASRTAGPTFELFYIGGYLLPPPPGGLDAHRGSACGRQPPRAAARGRGSVEGRGSPGSRSTPRSWRASS